MEMLAIKATCWLDPKRRCWLSNRKPEKEILLAKSKTLNTNAGGQTQHLKCKCWLLNNRPYKDMLVAKSKTTKADVGSQTLHPKKLIPSPKP